MPLYKINRIYKQAHSREKPPAMFETMRQHNQLAVVRLLVAVDLNGTNEKENHVHRLPYCILRKRAVNAFCLLGIVCELFAIILNKKDGIHLINARFLNNDLQL